MKLNDVVHLFWCGHYGGGEASPASPAKGVACLAAELMRWDEWFAGQPLRELFEERAFRLHTMGEGSPAAQGGDMSLQTIWPPLLLACCRHYCWPTSGHIDRRAFSHGWLTRDRRAWLELLVHAQGCLESRHRFRSREGTTLA
jgi:hypothetical protein